MDAAPTSYALWQQFLRYDPKDAHWFNRDRFVLSAGHASMLLYSLIHLAGIEAAESSYQKKGGEAITLADIESFREEGSRCPGHPEYGWTTGVESTTGQCNLARSGGGSSRALCSFQPQVSLGGNGGEVNPPGITGIGGAHPHPVSSNFEDSNGLAVDNLRGNPGEKPGRGPEIPLANADRRLVTYIKGK